MKKFIKRYKVFLLLVVLNCILIVVWPETGIKSLMITKTNLIDMLSVFPPFFILLGLLDVWNFVH